MSALATVFIKDRSSGSQYQDFLSHLPGFELALGYFDRYSEDALNTTLREIRKYLDSCESERNTAKRVYAMAVECLDNIRNHYNRFAFEGASALLSLTRESEHFCITAGNEISDQAVYHLQSRLAILQKLNAEELDREFLETLLRPHAARNDGAGLGLIIMARKRGNFVDHFFEEHEGKTFFYIRIKIAA